MDDRLTVSIEADTSEFTRSLRELEGLADGFGKRMTSALSGAVAEGKSLDDVLKRLALDMAGLALKQGMRPLQSLIGGAFSSIAGGLAGGAVTPFAKGGVVSAPSYFPHSGGLGLMGEAGPEAIMPLARGPDGALGVASPGGGPGSATINVTIHTPDSASFAKSEAQVTAMLARAARRGLRYE